MHTIVGGGLNSDRDAAIIARGYATAATIQIGIGPPRGLAAQVRWHE
jgi:phage/plasmid primase-like uncharacterized protein